MFNLNPNITVLMATKYLGAIYGQDQHTCSSDWTHQSENPTKRGLLWKSCRCTSLRHGQD